MAVTLYGKVQSGKSLPRKSSVIAGHEPLKVLAGFPR